MSRIEDQETDQELERLTALIGVRFRTFGKGGRFRRDPISGSDASNDPMSFQHGESVKNVIRFILEETGK